MMTEADWMHSDDEDRYVSIGLSLQGRLLLFSYTERVKAIRIISVREAAPKKQL